MNFYADFTRANSEYLGRDDEDALSVHTNLTLGCWVYFDSESTDQFTGIIGKWYWPGNECAFLLYKDDANKITFTISNNGSTSVWVSDGGVNYAENQWFYVVGRFTPNTELALFVNGMWYINTTSIPPDIFHSSEALEIGRYNRDNYLDGRVSNAFICAYSVPNNFICAMFAHARALYMSRLYYNRVCSSTSSSTSSSTTSTSSSSSSSTTSSSSSSVIP